jgi:DNA replication protein DnaC
MVERDNWAGTGITDIAAKIEAKAARIKMLRGDELKANKQRREDEEKLQADREWNSRLLLANLPTEGRLKDVTLSSYLQTENGREPYLRYIGQWLKKWPECKTGMVLAGEKGLGKTGLAISIAKRVMQENPGVNVSFIKVSALANAISQGWRLKDNSDNEIVKRLERVKLLVLDDLGASHKALAEWDESSPLARLYDILDTRYDMERPTIITTNCVSELELELIVNARNLERILDCAKFLVCTGQNLRKGVD